MSIEVHDATAESIDAAALYSLMRLRNEVLVVEQQSPYPDIDGRDLDPGTIHVWATDVGELVSCLRLLRTAEGWRIGRMCTAHRARGRGIARRLVSRTLELVGDQEIETSAQQHLEPWYESFGFRSTGPIYFEVGIPHVPMRRVPNGS